MSSRPVGLESLAIFIPEARHSSAHIAAETGIDQETLEKKFGIYSKSVAGPDDHPVGMTARAAREAMARAGVGPEDIDVVLWTGDIRGEKLWQTYGIALQKVLGCGKRPFAFDISQRCGSVAIGMLIAKGLVQIDPDVKTILLAGAARASDLIDYKNPRTRFICTVGTSASAAILKADSRRNEILGISNRSDGRFTWDMYVPAGGTLCPMSAEAIEQRQIYFDLPDPRGLKERLDKVSMPSFMWVVDDALKQSGLTREDVDYLSLVHMKRSAFEYVSREIGVEPYTQSLYAEDLGHTGGNDVLIGIDRADRKGMLGNGDIVLTASAGAGWAWNASVIRWGEPDRER